MRTGLIAGAVVLVAAIVAVLVAPSFIDWTRYKGEIATWVEQATGRSLTIGGDLSLSLLPPTLSASDVTFANAPEGTADHMVRMDELDVRVAVVPLISGRVEVESLRLIAPVVVLERLPDGRGNWEVAPADRDGPAGGTMPDRPGEPGPGSVSAPEGLRVALDRVVIEDGALIWRDGNGEALQVTGIGGEVAAESLLGPFAGDLSGTVRGARVAADLRLGRLSGSGQATPVYIDLTLPETGGHLRLSGRATGLGGGGGGGGGGDADAGFTGSLMAEADSLARVLDPLRGVPAPPQLDRPFRLAGEVTAGPAGASLDTMTLRLGETEGTGGVSVGFAPLAVDAALAFTRIDLDALLKEARAQPQAGGAVVPAAATPSPVPAPNAAEGGGGDVLPTLPPTVSGSLDVTADVVTWRGGLIRSLRLNAGLAGGEVIVNQAGALLPGSSEINLFGFIDTRATPAAVDGTVEVKSSNLRGLLDWLGAAPDSVPGDRLRRFHATAAVQGTATDVRIPSLEGLIDLTAFQGAAAVTLGGARPAVGLSLSVDQVNLDAYVPDAAAPAGPAGGAAGGTGAAGAGVAEAAEAPMLAGLEWLAAVDANVKASADLLTWDGTEIRDARLDAALVEGVATFGDTRIGAVAGSTLTIGGRLSGFGGTPRFDGLSLGIATNDPGRLARLLDIDLPVADADGLAPLTLSAVLTGTPAQLEVQARSEAAGGAFGLGGTVTGLATAPAVDLVVTADHDSLPALLGRLGIAYEPRGGRGLGPLSLTARARGDAAALTLSDLALTAGPSTANGTVTWTAGVADAPPRVTAALAVDQLPVDVFLPADRTASLPAGEGAIIPAAARTEQVADRWSRDPIDLSALTAVDADLALTAGALSYEDWRLTGADLTATLAGGRLTVPDLTGALFGGPFQLSATVTPGDGGAGVALDLSTAVEDMDIGAALAAASGTPSARGRLTGSLNATASGTSQAALIASLSGTGALRLSKVDLRRTGTGGTETALAAVLAPLRALDRMAGGLGGESYGVDVTGTMVLRDGVARTQEPLVIDSNLYAGTLTGAADLAAWTIDASGEARLTQTLLSGLLANQVKLPEVVPIALSGPLDAPNVRIGTARQVQEAQPAPEAQARDALEQLLREDVLGEDPPPAGEEAPAPKPEKVLRDSLKNLLLGR